MGKLKNLFLAVLFVILGGIVVLAFRATVIDTVRVDGTSMEPTLNNNELVYAFRHAKIHRGSVVVFDANGLDPRVTQKQYYIKRVIALPGDTVSAKNGVIKVNGKAINQNYLTASEREATTTVNGLSSWSSLQQLGEAQGWTRTVSNKVPAGEYFVLGDHRSVSDDSRYWGFVPKNKMVGVAKMAAWSKDADKPVVNTQWQHFFK